LGSGFDLQHGKERIHAHQPFTMMINSKLISHFYSPASDHTSTTINPKTKKSSSAQTSSLEARQMNLIANTVTKSQIDNLLKKQTASHKTMTLLALSTTVTARFFVILFSIILCVFIYACMWIFILKCKFLGFVLEGYFGLLVSKGKLVILVEDYCSILSEDHLFIKLLVCCGN